MPTSRPDPRLLPFDPPQADAPRDRHRPARLALAVALASGLALAGCGGGGSGGGGGSSATATASLPDPGATGGAPAAPSPSGASLDVAAVLAELNAARAVARSCGATAMAAVPPLRWNAALELAAAGHSEWMQANDVFSHTGAGGSSVGTRASAAGYAWKLVGENIAAGQPDVPSVIAAWLASPGHCMNIMHAGFVDVALALKPGTSSNTYRTWWTLVFGSPL